MVKIWNHEYMARVDGPCIHESADEVVTVNEGCVLGPIEDVAENA